LDFDDQQRWRATARMGILQRFEDEGAAVFVASSVALFTTIMVVPRFAYALANLFPLIDPYRKRVLVLCTLLSIIWGLSVVL
jgi:hypothetical protein